MQDPGLKYTIVFARSAQKEFERLDRVVSLRVLAKIEGLADSPRPHGCCKLQGENNYWRIRVGDYRVIYSIDDGLRIVDVSYIRHRSQAYK